LLVQFLAYEVQKIQLAKDRVQLCSDEEEGSGDDESEAEAEGEGEDDAEEPVRFKATVHQSMDQNRGAQIRSELRLLARFLIRFKKQFGRETTFLHCFDKDHVQYTCRAVEICTSKFQRAMQGRKLIGLVSKWCPK